MKCTDCGKTKKELEKETGYTITIGKCVQCKKYYCDLCAYEGCPDCSDIVPVN